MKKTKYLLCLLCLLFVSCECEKDDPNPGLESITDLILGEYRCKSMRFEGEPVDLNNDGICSVDLKEEFSYFSYSCTVFSAPNFIHAVSEYDTEEFFNLKVPIQGIKYDKVSNLFSLMSDYGSNFYVCFSYRVNTDGTFEFFTRNDRLNSSCRDSDWEILDWDNANTKGENVVYFDNGFLIVQIMGAYYDFHTKNIVTGPVELVYERVSYAVR